MTNINIEDFVLGLALLYSNYKTGLTKINVFEKSNISITGLRPFNKIDIKDFKEIFNWNVGNDVNGDGWAEYFKLDYLET